eukprot:1754750-Rhodomonas_salina.2
MKKQSTNMSILSVGSSVHPSAVQKKPIVTCQCPDAMHPSHNRDPGCCEVLFALLALSSMGTHRCNTRNVGEEEGRKA